MHPRLSTNAKWIWSVYLALTLGCAICYFVAGMDWFSAINYGMTTTATGGFSIHNDSLAHFHTPAIEYIGLIFQFASGINFTVLYMLIVKRQFKTFYKNSELRFYITLVAACTVVIALLLMTHNGYGVEHAFRSSCFQVVSLMTTTGIFCDHVGQWPHITWIILAALMFIGACAGSTSGGFKSIRAFMICKVIKNEFVRLLHPRAVLPVKVDGHAMPSAIVQNLLAFFAIYIIVCMATTGLMMAIGTDITNSAIISLSCVNNVGLPLNELGPDMAWSDMHWATKWLCAGLMLMGRLEILNVLILLTPSYWKDN
jgi:trk system potassium uptake protein TrkH